MGAFGELLDRHFGGTIHDVKTWGKRSIPSTNDEPKPKITAEDEVFNRMKDKVRYGYKKFSDVKREDFVSEESWVKFNIWAKNMNICS